MTTRERIERAAALAVLAGALAAPAALAQAGTPAAGPCTVEPRTAAEVARVAGTPPAMRPALEPAPTRSAPAAPTPDAAAQPAAPAEEPTGPGVPLPMTLPEGPPASDDQVAAMTAAMDQFASCYSEGEALRMMSLVTDAYLKQGFSGRPMGVRDVEAFAGTPKPLPVEEQFVLAAVRGPRVLDDGRIAALFDFAAVGGPVPGEIRTDFVVFREVDGRWLIDAYVASVPPDQYGPDAG